MSSNFLSKLKSEGKLELVEPSEQIFKSYNYKAKNYLGAAKVVQNAKYYESAISEAYYSMYNSVQSLLFICGIKCENHSAAAILLKKLFKLNNLFNIFSIAKEERIDKQYYVTTQQIDPVTKESAQNMINDANDFILEINAYITSLNHEKINKIRDMFLEI